MKILKKHFSSFELTSQSIYYYVVRYSLPTTMIFEQKKKRKTKVEFIADYCFVLFLLLHITIIFSRYFNVTIRLTKCLQPIIFDYMGYMVLWLPNKPSGKTNVKITYHWIRVGETHTHTHHNYARDFFLYFLFFCWFL